MEILDNVKADTISMVKLGSKYYALKDEDAARKSQFWDPEQPVTKQMLKAYYAPSFYETLSAAAADVNAGTVGTGVTENTQQENVAVYTDENGNTVVVLLADVTETVLITLEKDIILRLNGHTLNFTESGAYLIFASTVGNAVIDGKVPESKICKDLVQGGTAQEKLVEIYANDCKVYGGKYHMNVANNNYAAFVLLARGEGKNFYGENCDIKIHQVSGSKSIYGVISLSRLTLKNCTVDCQAAGGDARGVEVRAEGQQVQLFNCRIHVKTLGNAALGVYPRCNQAFIRDSEVQVSSTAPQGNTVTGKATAIQQYASKLTVENCHLSSSSGITHTNCIYAYQGEYWIRNTEILASSSENYAYALENLAAARGYLEGCTIVADATSSYADSRYSIGVLNCGKLTLKNCSAYGTHSGMQLRPNSHTYVTGGKFEGVGHGGIYFSNKNGSAYIQDAKILNAKYRGVFKNNYDYDNQYHIAGMYMGNDGITVVNNTTAYLDNCWIDGSTGNAVVLRSTGGEFNNAIYLSNCEVIGGTIRIDSDTHKLYVGKACNMVSAASNTECMVETNSVYHCGQGMPENMPKAAEEFL